MAYNFKKINDVPVVEAMKNDLNVFVEDGRKMAKIPANKMIPEDVALKSDIPEVIPVPATAEVGQVVAVKAVDENGKPTEWEAVDMSTGGGVACFYTQGPYLYVDKECTVKATKNDILSVVNKKTIVVAWSNGSIYTPAVFIEDAGEHIEVTTLDWGENDAPSMVCNMTAEWGAPV